MLNTIFQSLSDDLAQAFNHLPPEEITEMAIFNAAAQVRALTATFTGSENKSPMSGGLKVYAKFGDIAEHELPKRAALGFSQLFILIDDKNPVGPPVRFDFLFVAGQSARYFRDCSLWAPKSGRRMMIVPDADEPGFFRFKPNRALTYQPSELPGSFDEGFERALDRFADFMVSLPRPDLKDFRFSGAN